MDTSFKQYDYLTGMDLNAIAPFDVYAFTQSYQASTTTDPYGGITGGDPLLIQNAITQRQAAVDAYVQATDPYATVRDVIGGKVIQPFNLPHLASGLPYHVVTHGATYGTLPSNLSFHISFDFQTVDNWGFATGGTPITLPMAQLNNEKVTVSYKPATAADEQVLLATLPNDPYAEYPRTVPAYLVRVIPELKVNGQVVMTGNPVQMGSDHKVQYTINYPDGRTRGYASNFEAGTFHAVGIVGGSVSKDKLTNLQARVSQLQSDLYAGIWTGANKEAIHGDTFYAGMMAYFTQYYGITELQAQSASVEHLLQPSIGTMGITSSMSYFFGFPRNMTIQGTVMDVGKLVTVTTAHSGSAQERLNFSIMQAGLLSSALEHQVPEQIFSTAQVPVQGISAVKLLGMAKAQGMPVYQINKNNMNSLMPKLTLLGNVVSEIQAGLASGKEIIVHQSPLALNGWTGTGYIIYDPVTGDGAYKISGGYNGGILSVWSSALTALLLIYEKDWRPFYKKTTALKGARFIGHLATLQLFLDLVSTLSDSSKTWGERWLRIGALLPNIIMTAATPALLAAGPIGWYFLFMGTILSQMLRLIAERAINKSYAYIGILRLLAVFNNLVAVKRVMRL